jgi:hypothetical protein
MKQVVNKIIDPNIIGVSELINPHTRTYIAVNPGNSVCMLMHEPQGYIFRNVTNHTYGHSGHHETIFKTISRALDLRETKVFEFPSLAEAAAYITHQ